MTDATALSDIVRQALCEPVTTKPYGRRGLLLQTPVMFPDGDILVIRVQPDPTGEREYEITDAGHTLMHLATLGIRVTVGKRGQIFDAILDRYGIENRDGELRTSCTRGQLGSALVDFIQCLVRVTDLGLLRRQVVRELFMEEFRAFVADVAREVGWRAELDYVDPSVDPHGRYCIDARLGRNGAEVFVFGIHTDAKCRDATITILYYERTAREFISLGVFQDQTRINRHVLARFSDVCDRQFPNLSSARERLARFLQRLG